MIEPGVYRLHYGRLSLGECWRLSAGPLAFVFGLGLKLVGTKGGHVWLPSSQSVVACPEEALTVDARAWLLPAMDETKRLGYRRGFFRRGAKIIDPRVRDAGAYCALHDDGRRIMLAAYTHTVLEFVVGKPPADPTRHEVHLSGVLITEDLGGIAVLDYKQHFDTLSTRAIQVGPIGVVAIDRRLAQEMGAMREPLRHFATVEELEAALRERGDRMYGRLVERRVFRRVPEQEEQEVLARFGLKAGD